MFFLDQVHVEAEMVHKRVLLEVSTGEPEFFHFVKYIKYLD
jgi:hypothetical protein